MVTYQNIDSLSSLRQGLLGKETTEISEVVEIFYFLGGLLHKYMHL